MKSRAPTTFAWKACVPAGAPGARTATTPRIIIGAEHPSHQHGLLGNWRGSPVSLDLAGCHTISLFGVQGFGKSYSLGTIAEMATTAIPGVNVLPNPLATMAFHYHRSDAYPPELLAARRANDDPLDVARLARAGLSPQAVADIVLLTPSAKVASRRLEYPDLDVRPITFSADELGAEGWRLLMGAAGNDALYLRQLVSVLRRHRNRLNLAMLREELQAADLSPAARRLVDDRLALASEYLTPDAGISGVFRPGRTVIVDLRDEWIEKDEALVLFIVLMRIFSRAGSNDAPFNRLVVFDEAHKYLADSEMIGEVTETIREVRHHGTSVLIASQDPISIPRAIVELSSTVILHRLTSPLWLRHLRGAISSLQAVADQDVASLQPGEALVWAQRSTEHRFTERPQKVQMRTRVSKHGGSTRLVAAPTPRSDDEPRGE